MVLFSWLYLVEAVGTIFFYLGPNVVTLYIFNKNSDNLYDVKLMRRVMCRIFPVCVIHFN